MSARSAAASSIFDLPISSKTPTKKKTTSSAKVAKTTKVRTLAKKAPAPDLIRTSQLLQGILTKNPDLESFTVEKIVSEIGTTSFGTSLMFFAIPEVIPIPIPGISAIVVLPTGVLSAQMAAGQKQVRLPKFLLKRSVPRKALAAAIHTMLPFLRRAEKVTKPRWAWATSPAAQRLLGIFIFILALAIAFPIPGFNMPQAIAIFIIGFGLVEKDGLIICLGVLIGLASLVLLGAVLFGLSSLLGFGGFGQA